ncbi:MAG TPA: Nif3-like dinuclear metal center hexameric protein, partial [bacterium]
MKTAELAYRLNRLLNVRAIQDDSLNGLQIDNSGNVQTVAFAVDVSQACLVQAQEKRAQFLIVHHGLFWGKPVPLTGALYEWIRSFIRYDIALYAVHLPLDLHPQFGNNAQLVKLFGWKKSLDFGEYHGQTIGKAVILPKPLSLSELAERMRRQLRCEPLVWRFGDPKVKRIAFLSGGAMSMIGQVAEAGYDTLVTGEPSHSYYWAAKDSRINVLFGGHYQTETVG